MQPTCIYPGCPDLAVIYSQFCNHHLQQLAASRGHMTITASTIPLIFVMGVTNTGKSTIMETMRGYEYAGVGLVEVGKMMRAKYPPDYFKGQGAPQHTQTEAWKMMTDGIAAHADAGRKVVLIDGQPRNWEQMEWALAMPNPKTFLHLWAPPQTRLERAHKRDATDLEKLKLTLARLQDDVIKLYDIISFLHLRGERVEAIDTTSRQYAPFPVLKSIVNHFTGHQVL